MRAGPDAFAPLWRGIAAGVSAEDDEDSSARRYRAIFISDLHLGTAGCQAKALLGFLKAHPSDHLYLVGDIVDGWQLRRRWFWPQSHNDVVQKLLRRARKGCRVVFVPGNHYEFARAFLGDNLYEFTLKLNRYLNSLRARMGLPYWSLSTYLKHKVKSALNYVTSFDVAVAQAARSQGHDGVVCGHIHRAEMRDINGTLYCNDGDWVESRSALVEHLDGHLELVYWNAEVSGPVALPALAGAAA